LLLSEAKRWRRKRRHRVVVLWKEGKTILDMAADLGVNEKTVDRDLKTSVVQAMIIPIKLRRWKL
jgi:predicted DNA-binding transcriptional regulator YafY